MRSLPGIIQKMGPFNLSTDLKVLPDKGAK